MHSRLALIHVGACFEPKTTSKAQTYSYSQPLRLTFFSAATDRKERKSYAVFVSFGDPTPPAAHPGAIQAVTSLCTQTRKLAHDVEKVSNRTIPMEVIDEEFFVDFC